MQTTENEKMITSLRLQTLCATSHLFSIITAWIMQLQPFDGHFPGGIVRSQFLGCFLHFTPLARLSIADRIPGKSDFFLYILFPLLSLIGAFVLRISLPLHIALLLH